MATGQATRPAPLRPAPARSVLRLPSLTRASAADWAQLLRFCVVGASGYVVNLAVFAGLVYWAGAHHLVAAVGAFCLAWLNNFALNRHWTFTPGHRSALSQGTRYLIVSLIALLLNLVLLQLLVTGGVGELPAQAAAVLLVTPVAFLMNRRWAFR